MTSRTIEIIVSPAGQTRVETRGFAGSECRQASEFLEQALGQRTSEQLTAEFHSAANTTTDEHLRQQE
ncbi:MAG: DUF2997 domain-containing protein [Planctomycetaceae bacterium]|nr:DUF2997 domain-containing protein [Planctomycetaceae bacterium]